MLVRSGPDIKHQTVIRLQIFTESLEEPFMGIYFSIIPLFDSKHKVDSPSAQDFHI